MSLTNAFVPIVASPGISNTVISATASPGTIVASIQVPPVGSLPWIYVQMTNVDVQNADTAAVSITWQIYVNGFGVSTPVYATLSHATNGATSIAASSGIRVGDLTWTVFTGTFSGNTFNWGAGGTIGFAAFASVASELTVGADYLIVYGWYGGAV